MTLVAGLASFAFREARSEPIVRRVTIGLPRWPAGRPPIRVALLSDLHVGNASTSPARLARVVSMTNALHPDLVLIAGDFLPGDRPIKEGHSRVTLAALSGLSAPLGVFAVLGNHDYYTGAAAVRDDLERLHVTLLDNAATVVGPIALGGVSDPVTGHERTWPVFQALRRLPGARVILTHSPELAPFLPGDMPLLLAGHTHCGQVSLFGASPIMVEAPRRIMVYRRYICGIVRDPGRTTIVTAGIGTSGVPFRLGAPPDMWLLTLGPK